MAQFFRHFHKCVVTELFPLHRTRPRPAPPHHDPPHPTITETCWETLTKKRRAATISKTKTNQLSGTIGAFQSVSGAATRPWALLVLLSQE